MNVKNLTEQQIDGLSTIGSVGSRFNAALGIYESEKSVPEQKASAYGRMCSYYAVVQGAIEAYELFGVNKEVVSLIKLFNSLDVLGRAKVITLADKLLRDKKIM